MQKLTKRPPSIIIRPQAGYPYFIMFTIKDKIERRKVEIRVRFPCNFALYFTQSKLFVSGGFIEG